jgi:hypothetical protein
MYTSGRDVLPRLERGVSDGRAVKENEQEGTCSNIFEMRSPNGLKASSSGTFDFDGSIDWTVLRTSFSVNVWCICDISGEGLSVGPDKAGIGD